MISMPEIDDEVLGKLETDSALLDALYDAGVDSWEGYEIAVAALGASEQRRLSVEAE